MWICILCLHSGKNVINYQKVILNVRGVTSMKSNPDIFLLYEYMKRVSFTVRIKVILDEPADAKLLNQAAQEAIKRFPYFSVCLGLDTHGNYTLSPNPYLNPAVDIPIGDALRSFIELGQTLVLQLCTGRTFGHLVQDTFNITGCLLVFEMLIVLIVL